MNNYISGLVMVFLVGTGLLTAPLAAGSNYGITTTNGLMAADTGAGQLSDDESFSIESWICPTAANIGILGYFAINDEEGLEFMASAAGYKLELVNNKLKFTVANDWDWDEEAIYESITGASSLPLNRWTHVAAVYDKASRTITVFVNGKQDGTTTISYGCTTPETTSFMAGYALGGSGGTPFSGFLDEIRMWKEVKTADFFKQNMFKPLTGSESNLIVYFNFNEGTGSSTNYLSIGAGNVLVTKSTIPATFSWVPSGAFSGPRNAIEFDGSNDHIAISSMPEYNNSTLTIEAWIKTSSELPEREICSWSNNAQSNVVEFRVSEGKFQFGIDAGGWESVMGSTNVNTNEWTHVAAVRNGSTVTLYVNGRQDASGTVNRNPTVNQFHIGGLFQYGITRSYYFPGAIDEVRVWNIVRSQADIQAGMMNTVDFDATGLVAYYRMDETEGTTVYDLSTNAKHGTMTNMDPASDRVASAAYNTWMGTSSAVGSAFNWSNGAVSDNQNVSFCIDIASNPVFNPNDKFNFNTLYNGAESTLILRSDATGTSQLSVEKEIANPGDLILRKTFAPDRWYFFSLPYLATFDAITTEGTLTKAKSGNFFSQNPATDQYYLLSYDGAGRNTSGTASTGSGLHWSALYDTSSGAPALKVSEAGGAQQAPTGFVTIQAGKGYIMAVPAAITLDFRSPTNTTNPFKKSSLSASTRVDGNPNENPIHRHWNLVGNLYQKGFNLDALDQDTYYYIYNNATQTYDVKEAADAYQIDPNSAFFMQAGASTINFAESGRVFKAPAKKESAEQERILLELSGNLFSDKTEIRFSETASNNYVINEDACKFLSMNSEVPQLWTRNNNLDYAVQHLPETTEQLALCMKLPAGMMELKISNQSAVAESYDVLLTDVQANKRINLSKENYSFIATAGTFTNRFNVQLLPATNTAVENTEAGLLYRLQDGKLQLSGLSDVALLTFYDLNGKVVQKAEYVAADATIRLLQKGAQILEIKQQNKLQRIKLMNIY